MIELDLSKDVMSYYYLLGVGGLFALWGGMYVVQGIKRTIKQNVVPIEDISEIKELAADFPESNTLKDGLDDFGKTAKDEDLSFQKSKNEYEEKSMSIGQGLQGESNQLEERIRLLSLENDKLKQALDREITSKDPITLVEEEKQLLERYSEDSKRKQVSINRLSEENLRLGQQLQEVKQKNTAILDDLTKLKNQYQFLFSQAKLQIRNLREEFSELSEESNQNITKAQLEAIDRMKNDKDELFRTLKRQEVELQEFQSNIDLVKENYEKKLTQLKKENEELQGKANSQGKIESIQSEEMKGMLEQLKKDKENLKASELEREMDFKKLKELNQGLLEKESMLQYELAKNRAQAVGLERVCEDFKIRIESMEEELAQAKNEVK